MGMSYPRGPAPSDVSAMLAGQIEAVIAALGLEGQRSANRFRFMAPWPNSDTRPKVDCYVTGARTGAWIHWTSDLRGDALDLVAAVLDGGGRKDRTRGDAYIWALNFLGLATPKNEGAADKARREEAQRQRILAAQQQRAAAEADARRELAEDRRRARGQWLAGVPLSPGDPVWTYLAARGIDLLSLPRLPGALRWMMADHVDGDGELTSWPCMLAAMTLADGTFGCLHRTWIDPNRPGKKAPIEASRKMWPSPLDDAMGGAAIRLSRGASGKPVMKAEPKSELVVVCEGVEDGLSLAMLFPEARVEAAGALSLFQSWPIPASAREVRIAADRDWDKPQAVKALERASQALRQGAPEGVKVGLIYPPDGYKDWNDALMDNDDGGAE